jgi:hypothetical protein
VSSKRNIRRKQCERKIRFGSAGAARQRSKAIVRAGGDLLDVYPCEFCGGWHIGHRPARVETAIAEKCRDLTLERKVNRGHVDGKP